MQIKCSCGKALKVPDSLAGKQAKCPACGKVFKVPAGKSPPPPQGAFGLLSSRCPQCQAELDPCAQFCVSCGTHLATGAKYDAVSMEDVQEEKKSARTKLIIVIVCVVLGVGVFGSGVFALWKFVMAAEVPWPSETGYVTEPKNRPSSPHDVRPTSTKLVISQVTGDTMRVTGKSEIRNNEELIVFPGARITNGRTDGKRVELEDYNGDWCVLPFGITVRVDKYEQFVPVKYDGP